LKQADRTEDIDLNKNLKRCLRSLDLRSLPLAVVGDTGEEGKRVEIDYYVKDMIK
jgi:hypothetical protein